MARIRPGEQALNPWVVLADCTIALTFLLILFGLVNTLQNSQSLILLQRQQKQKELRKAVTDVLVNYYPGAKVGEWDKKTRTQFVYWRDGGQLAKIEENASYQRISLYCKQFEPQEAGYSLAARYCLVEIGKIAQKRIARLDYVYLHGIAGDEESADSEERVRYSRSRADVALGILQSEGVVGRDLDDKGVIPVDRAIPYGTGSKLYSTGWPLRARVDIVLFYKDIGTYRDVPI